MYQSNPEVTVTEGVPGPWPATCSGLLECAEKPSPWSHLRPKSGRGDGSCPRRQKVHGCGRVLTPKGLCLRRRLNVGPHHANFVVFLGQVMEQNVAQGDDCDHAVTFADKQM